jgi:hypothetical protein
MATRTTTSHDGGSMLDCGIVLAELAAPVALKFVANGIRDVRMGMAIGDITAMDSALEALKTSIIDTKALLKLENEVRLARVKNLAESLGSCFKPHSFAAGTGVMMANGQVEPIEQVQAGDWVANAQPGGHGEVHRVDLVHVTTTDTDFTDLTVATSGGQSTITSTQNHPYYDVTRHEFVDASRLAVGDRLQAGGTEPATVVAVRDYSGAMVTYDLTIHDVHTYYVVASGVAVLVHNTMPCSVTLDALSAMGREIYSDKLTQAGCSYRKHMDKGQLPVVPKVPEKSLNDAGGALLDDILTDPHSQFIQYPDGRFRIISNSVVNPWKGVGKGDDYFVGVTFRSDGTLQYFGVYK